MHGVSEKNFCKPKINKATTNSEYKAAKVFGLQKCFWLSVGSPISPDVRPRGGGTAKILNQF